MDKLKSNFINMTLVLTGSVLFAGFVLGSMSVITKEPIDAAKATKLQNAIRQVLPPFDRLSEPESVEMDGSGTFMLYNAFDNNHNFVGAAVESFSKNGFSGEIKVMVGFDKQGNIVNYSVLEQKETPGLGTKMVDWFKPVEKTEKSVLEKLFGYEVKPIERKSSIIGKNPERDRLKVVKDGGEIDAITAATISSRAFLETIRSAYEAYQKTNYIHVNDKISE
jgi:electron transport complex protein RnfG